jgi:hypothetical protein
MQSVFFSAFRKVSKNEERKSNSLNQWAKNPKMPSLISSKLTRSHFFAKLIKKGTLMKEDTASF